MHYRHNNASALALNGIGSRLGAIPLGVCRTSSSFLQYFLICASVIFSARSSVGSFGLADWIFICGLRAISEVDASSVMASTSAGSTLDGFLFKGTVVVGFVTLVGLELKERVCWVLAELLALLRRVAGGILNADLDGYCPSDPAKMVKAV